MSEKKIDKAKAAQKLHKLQKKLNRTDENESWLNRKIKQIRELKLIQILKSKTLKHK
jgi:hypothetical protein